MLAIRKLTSGRGALAIQELDHREPGAGEVLLKIAAAGICGTDMHIYRWADWLEGRVKFPVTLGHEVSGTIVKNGPGPNRFKEGTYVALESHVPCGHCKTCLRGDTHVCPQTTYPGMSFDGGFAEYLVAPESICWPVSPELPSSVAALYEPFGLAVHSCSIGTGVQGQSVVVAGCGPLGLMAVAAARELGASEIIALETNPKRREHAERIGATKAFDPSARSPSELRRDINGGEGADVFLEYSGAAQSMQAIPILTRVAGSVRLIGVQDAPVPISFGQWILKGLKVEGIHGRRLHETWLLVDKLLPRLQKPLSSLISHELGLAEGLQGFDLIEEGEAVKVIFRT
jgi:threonine 3-dehydrogenase